MFNSARRIPSESSPLGARFRRSEPDQQDELSPPRSFARGDVGETVIAPAPSDQATQVQSPPAASESDMPLTMPAPAEVAKEDIDRIGVEGIPGDAKFGPGMLRVELFALALILGSAALGTAYWLGWAGALAVLGWVALAFVFNPVFWAMLLRIKDRRRAVREERSHIIVRAPHTTHTSPRPDQHVVVSNQGAHHA